MAVHRFETGDAPSVATRMYRSSKLKIDCINQNTSTLIENGLVRPSKPPYAAPPVPVMDGHKGDGTPKPCICFYYRALNAQTKSDMYPMPLVDEELAANNGAQWFSTMYLMKGFYQIPMDPEDCCKTAFITEQGLFEFDVMPFGLKNAPATFQRAMQNALAGCQDFCRIHVNDIIIYSKTFKDHLEHLKIVLGRLRDANLKVAPAKCYYGMILVKYLGHIVDRAGNRPDPEKVQAVQDTPQPKTMSQLKGLLGLSGYYRAFYKDYAQMVHPLTELTKYGTDVTKDWTAERDAAFLAIKERLANAPILRRPDLSKGFTLQADWQPNGDPEVKPLDLWT